jgi:Zn-dependent peptidase ImmA (M78 family)/DNA-binding XRE family transcriptional regulator
MADKVHITPQVIKWARESAHIRIEDAAHKIKISSDKLLQWESGTEQPTIKQAERLAKMYKRPLALFFLPEIPKDFQPLQDFRRKDAKPLETSSIFIIRELQEKQSWMSEFLAENGEDSLPFVGKYTINTRPEVVAEDILQVLNINPQKYTYETPIKEWILKAESKGIFISRTSFIHSRMKLDSDELQGFAIADKYAPFVFINSDDWNAAQLFTLVHELVHIWIAESGISNEIIPDIDVRNGLHPVELFCNETAAIALMPTELLKSIDKSVFNSGNSLYSNSKSLGVSTFAFLIRALRLQLITKERYFKLREDAEADFRNYIKKDEDKKLKQKAREGGPNPFLLRLNKNSRLFTQIILDSYKGGSISPSDASGLLNTKINNFNKLEAILYR